MAIADRHDTRRRGRLTGDDLVTLVAQAADGDQEAWNALVAQFGGVVWAAARAHRLSGADAADATQATWLRLVENLDRIQDPRCLGQWLATTARRECLVILRRTARVVPCGDDLPELPSDEAHPAERLMDGEHAAALRVAVERLRPRDRALLRMLSAEPRPSYEEIGAALDMPIGSIGPTRARALQRLSREMHRAGLRAASGLRA